MTDEQKAALKWLDMFAAGTLNGLTLGRNEQCCARTLKAMLAEPRLPEEPSEEAISAMYAAWRDDNYALIGFANIYRALYAHLTKPKTKTVEVWRVEYAVAGSMGTADWLPLTRTFMNEESARLGARDLAASNQNCIHVTGPHKQEVPA